MLPVATAAAAAPASPRRTAAEQDQRDALLELLQRRPRGVEVEQWRAQRREAARELGRLREPRALPTLLSIVAAERFDVILEIAIDALGNIGDARAIEPLRALLSDPSIDAYVRDATATALGRLGAPASSPTTQSTADSHPADPTEQATGAEGSALSAATGSGAALPPSAAGTREGDGSRPSFEQLHPLPATALANDALALSETLEIVGSTGEIGWDGGAERVRAALALGARYRRQLERPRIGYSLAAATDVDFRVVDPPHDDDTSWTLQHALQLRPELRYYPFRTDLPLLCGQVSGGLDYGFGLGSPAAALDQRTSFGAVASVGLGPAYGRIYDVGPRLRLRRFERVLRRAGRLEQPLDADLANKLLARWYALRNSIGSYAQLGYALRTLRESGVLGGELDAATTYRLVRVLDDAQLAERRAGFMLRLGYGYARQIVHDAADSDLGFLYASAEGTWQRGSVRERFADLRFTWNQVEGDSYALSAQAGQRWFLYNRALDPLGALGVSASAGISQPGAAAFEGAGVAYQLLAGGTYQRFFARGSRIEAALRGGVDRRGGLFLLTLSATYGVASGAYAAVSR
ncbi:MAG: HEAT repeat domain-containing protein [Proteobacteria bacterium]|nr:HEAT repeat domain-containing protein [Pseudomonadota bacterium]